MLTAYPGVAVELVLVLHYPRAALRHQTPDIYLYVAVTWLFLVHAFLITIFACGCLSLQPLCQHTRETPAMARFNNGTVGSGCCACCSLMQASPLAVLTLC